MKEALARAEHLEQQQEQTAKQNAEQLAVLQQQQSDLEAALQQERESLAALQQELAQAQAAGEDVEVVLAMAFDVCSRPGQQSAELSRFNMKLRLWWSVDIVCLAASCWFRGGADFEEHIHVHAIPLPA